MRRALPLVLLLAACAPLRNPAAPLPAEEREPVVMVDTATMSFFNMLHARATQHLTQPDQEIVLCLYGTIERNVIAIETFRSPRILEATDTTVRYMPCGGDGYLGTWHTHPVGPWGDGCWHSDSDRAAFHARQEDIIALVTCKGGRLMALVKKGYSRR